MLTGPPGAGKTMLARRMPGILPPLTVEEALEVTKVHSAAGESNGALVRERPFRAPHHTISTSGLAGGGGNPRPGEVSLAHHGVLFLDEFPEFGRITLEVLRQPLEDGCVTISRVAAAVEYPARVTLVCSMNHCPCGYAGDARRACRCTAGQVERYQSRVSGPLLDMIDLFVEVPRLAREELRSGLSAEPSRAIRERVTLARERQTARQGVPNSAVRSRRLRDRLLVNYSPLVKYVAGRVSGRTTYPLEQQDVLAWGILGLLDAVETYDPGRGTKFETYAISKIRWAILDELRKADPLPRRLRLRAQQVEGARGALAQRLGRSPTEQELVGELGVDASEHRAFLLRCHLSQAASLEARVEFDGVPHAELHELIRDNAASDPELAAEMSEVRARLVAAIRTLNERERVVTSFYFYEGLTLREIGKALGLTEGRISQILRRALINLRERLAESRQVS